MVGDNLTLLITHDAVLLLLTAHSHQLKGLKQIRLVDKFPSVFHGIDRRFIDHIGKIRSHQTGSCQCQCIQIHCLIHVDILGMDLERLQTPFQIRLIHDDPAVKTARTKQRLV